MILDNEGQRELLLQIISAVNFPGTAIDQAYALKISVLAAEVKQHEEKKEI